MMGAIMFDQACWRKSMSGRARTVLAAAARTDTTPGRWREAGSVRPNDVTGAPS
jgi:hypothetical protein